MAQTATDLRAAAHDISARNGVPPALFVKQIQQESGFNPDAHNDASGADGIAQVIVRWHPEMEGRTRDPLASLEYAARLMAGYYRQTGSWRRALAAYNWGIGNVVGYTKTDGTVVPPWDGRRETLPAETRRYLDVILGEGWPEPASGSATTNEVEKEEAPILSAEKRNRELAHFGKFDPATPDEKQRQDWTCAIRSTMWLLKSIGIAVTPDEAQDAMSLRYVTPELGLRDATGAGIVAVLRDRWGVTAENHASVTFDEVAALAGKQPVAIGGRNWGGPGKGHWSAVRGFDGTRLLLANPASGPVYGDPSLTREQWAWRGPWSAVVVPVAEEPAQPAPDDLAALRQQVVSLTAQLEDKARRLDTEVSKVGYMTGDLADALQAVVNTLRSLRPTVA